MSSLLENVINRNLKIDFNFSKSLNENIYQNTDHDPDISLPIPVRSSSWEIIQNNNLNFMFKEYNFKYYKHLEYFITEILKKSNKIKHHPVIIIDESNVQIKLFTKNINDVSDLDIYLSKFIDEIYEEINYILEL